MKKRIFLFPIFERHNPLDLERLTTISRGSDLLKVSQAASTLRPKWIWETVGCLFSLGFQCTV